MSSTVGCQDSGLRFVLILSVLISVQFRSVQSLSRVRLSNPMNHSIPGLSVHHQLPEFTQAHIHRVSDSIESVMPSSHLILCHPLLLLPPTPPSIRVFSNESTLHMRWPKYWSFSFSIIPSKEIPGLISFRMDWFDPYSLLLFYAEIIRIHSFKDTYMCMVESFWYPLEAITLSIGCTPIQNKMFKEKNVLIQSIELPPCCCCY